MNFEAKDEIGAAVERAYKLVRSRERGDVIAWSTLEAAAGFDQYTQHWTQFMKRLRRESLSDNRGIKLAAVNGVGLKLMTVAEQVHDVSRQRRARRQLNRAVKELNALPNAVLTDHQRQAKQRKIDLAKAARRGADYALRVGHKLAKPSDNGIPRVRVAG